MASLRKVFGKARKDGTRPVRWRVRWRDRGGAQREQWFDEGEVAAARRFRAEKELTPGAAGRRTLAEAIALFLAEFEALSEAGERRRSTYEQKRQHLKDHVAARAIGARQLAELGPADLQALYGELIAGGVSYALARKIQASLRQFWDWAAVREWTSAPGAARAAKVAAPRSKRLAQPVEIPPRDEIRAMLEAADARASGPRGDRGRARALFRLTIFGGLRAGEVRALRRKADLKLIGPAPGVWVRRSADKFGEIHDAPKTDASHRFVPLGPDTIAALREWSLAAPAGPEDLLFPTGKGRLWSHSALWRDTWTPVMRAADLAAMTGRGPVRAHPRGDYAPAIWTPRYGPKTARHIAASVMIAEGARPKQVMARMGHATIRLTMDLYAHLWEAAEEDAAMAARAERAFD